MTFTYPKTSSIKPIPLKWKEIYFTVPHMHLKSSCHGDCFSYHHFVFIGHIKPEDLIEKSGEMGACYVLNRFQKNSLMVLVAFYFFLSEIQLGMKVRVLMRRALAILSLT